MFGFIARLFGLERVDLIPAAGSRWADMEFPKPTVVEVTAANKQWTQWRLPAGRPMKGDSDFAPPSACRLMETKTFLKRYTPLPPEQIEVDRE